MEAIQRLRQRLEENPNDASAVRQLADMNYNIQNWSRAAELYERFLELQPDDVNAMTDLGACYRATGDPARALELFRRVREREPDHWQSRFNEIIVLAFDLGDLAAADEQMAELRKLAPGNSDVERLAEEIAKRR